MKTVASQLRENTDAIEFKAFTVGGVPVHPNSLICVDSDGRLPPLSPGDIVIPTTANPLINIKPTTGPNTPSMGEPGILPPNGEVGGQPTGSPYPGNSGGAAPTTELPKQVEPLGINGQPPAPLEVDLGSGMKPEPLVPGEVPHVMDLGSGMKPEPLVPGEVPHVMDLGSGMKPEPLVPAEIKLPISLVVIPEGANYEDYKTGIENRIKELLEELSETGPVTFAELTNSFAALSGDGVHTTGDMTVTTNPDDPDQQVVVRWSSDPNNRLDNGVSGINQESPAPTDFDQGTKPPADFDQDTKPPAGFDQDTKPPAGFDQETHTVPTMTPGGFKP